MSSFEIVRLGPTNAHLLEHIAPNLFEQPLDAGRLVTYLAQPGTMLVVATVRSTVVGQAKAAVHQHPDKPADLYLDELRVTPDHRRQGIARALLRELELWARDVGCADMWLATPMDNQEAQGLYDQFARSKQCLIYYWDL